MGKFILGVLLGLIVGGALIFYFFIGAPRSAKAPGAPIKPPEAGGPPPGTATVVLNQQFFDTILGTIFRDINAPSFPLGGAAQNVESVDPKMTVFGLQQPAGCESKITLKPEGSGVQTGVRLEEGKINAPLAFTGNYNIPFVGCTQFAGWAQGNLELRFDEQQQTVFGQINVETVNLDGVMPVASGFVTPLVQSSLNNRVNPIEVLRGQQIALNVPINAADGRLQAKVKDVRSEIKENALYLYVTYDFTGTRGLQPTP
ncbi:MAG TPA: hypothetical protein VEX64_06005 [Pyrinomonadaceae bacterium]|jgi:hypothetical protein|nr:hypothetical protein [Pyrinomonadaceae bacterium]